MSLVIEAKDLVKKYDENRNAVNGVNLEVKKGEIFGLLGPNGAGKTTALKMMYCSTSITSGELYVLGLNAKNNFRDIKKRVGIVPQEDGLDADFSVEENITLFGGYQRIDSEVVKRRTQELLRLMRLEDEKATLIPKLSGGMRRRLALARGLVNNPEILFLDEPTAGLDPDVRVWIWDFLEKITAELGTVILTTHYMEEAERLCHRVAIMEKGKILTLGTPAQLIKDNIGKEVVEFEIAQRDIVYYVDRLKQFNYRYQVVGKTLNVHLAEDQDSQAVLKVVQGLRVTIRRPNLNDVFLKLAGHSLIGDAQ